MNLFKYLKLLAELMYFCLNKLTSKYGKRAVIFLLYTLYKAWTMSESSFSHLFSEKSCLKCVTGFFKLGVHLVPCILPMAISIHRPCRHMYDFKNWRWKESYDKKYLKRQGFCKTFLYYHFFETIKYRLKTFTRIH